jgi:SAM-dependent MidA family methyltransferase
MHIDQEQSSLTKLEYRLSKIIGDKGFLSIADFMEQALYDKGNGYYSTKNPIGYNNDFITAPEISQLFGEMLGIWCVYNWQKLGEPGEIIIAELGPGRATLMRDMLRATKNMPRFHNAITSINLIEISPILREIQLANLEPYQHLNIIWHQDLAKLDNKPMLLIANEFFDCMPIYQFQKNKQDWYEIIVDLLPRKEGFYFNKTLANQQASNLLELEYSKTKDGDIVEISPVSIDLIKKITDRIVKFSGAAAIIDYGYTEEKRAGYTSSLQAIKSHKFHPVLQNIGEADITAHVDFTSLEKAAKVRGINGTLVQTQNEFLQSFGIEYRASQLCEKATMAQKKDIISGLDRLTAPNQMGELFKVLLLSSI